MSSIHSKMNLWKITTIILTIVLLTSSIFFFTQSVKAESYTVGLTSPTSSLVKITAGQTTTLTIHLLNGSAPYHYSWSYKIWYSATNSTAFTEFSTEQKPSFTLNNLCQYINFIVTVTDANGMTGFGSTTIWDPVALSTLTITGGIYPGAPSYTVWGESGTYYAKGANGNIDWSSTNATYVIQSAISSTTNPKTIFISPGTYDIQLRYTLQAKWACFYENLANTKIIGSGIDNTIFKLTSFTGGAGSYNAVFLGAANTNNLTLSDFTIDGSNIYPSGQSTVTTASTVGYVYGCYIENSQNINVNNVKGTGLYVFQNFGLSKEISVNKVYLLDGLVTGYGTLGGISFVGCTNTTLTNSHIVAGDSCRMTAGTNYIISNNIFEGGMGIEI
jgi:hypothetical protein